MTADARADEGNLITRMGGRRFTLAGAALTAIATVAALPSLRAGAVVMVVLAGVVAWVATLAVRVARSVGYPGRQVWTGFAAHTVVLSAATAATGVVAWTEGESKVPPDALLGIWIACSAALVVSGSMSFRALRLSRGWQEILDNLLVIVIVTMTIVFLSGSSPISPRLPDLVEIVVVGLCVIAVFCIIFAVGRTIVSHGQSSGPLALTFSSCIATIPVLIINLVSPMSSGWIALTAGLTTVVMCMWTASAYLRLRDRQVVQLLRPHSRPSMWRELLPAMVLVVLVVVVFVNGGVGALVGALVAAGLVAGRMTLTLVQYRRLLDQEHDRLMAHERTLIEERYTRFAMEETHTELVEDNLRLRGQEHDRLAIIQLLQDAVLVPSRELRADLARLSGERNIDVALATQRLLRLGARTEAAGNALDDLVTYSLIVEGELTLTRSHVAVEDLALRVIQELEGTIDRTGVSLQVDGEASAGVLIDPDLIAQVLRRLIVSALLSSDRGGLVTVLLRQSDDVVVIEISDRGPSYASEDLPYLFIPFYRPRAGTREQPGCVGLAFTNARSILSMHGGVIRILSPARGGVQIRISLPVDLTDESPPPFRLDGSAEPEGTHQPETPEIAGMLPTEQP